MTPNVERIRLWADELLTTDKKQGAGYLRYDDAYCCLGIAVEVAIANGCEVMLGRDDATTMTYDGSSGLLPYSVTRWYGIDADPIVAAVDGRTVTATDANDVRHYTFAQIAAGIIDFYGLEAQ